MMQSYMKKSAEKQNDSQAIRHGLKQYMAVTTTAKSKKLNKSMMASVVFGAMMVSACQSTGGLNTAQGAAQGTPEQAKANLQQTLKSQLRQSFSYESELKLSNINRRTALANATPEQLTSTSSRYTHCENKHDLAYAALMEQAANAGNEVTDSQYSDERENIKSDYLSCSADSESWFDNRYDYSSDDYDYADSQELSAEELRQEQINDFYENYDSDHTYEDVKRADAADAYLLDNLTGKASGIYQPIVGRFTFLPSVNYQTRNLKGSMNQPIYVDLRDKSIYFWADNFAYPVSEYLDDKLGTQWQNKWLKLALDDGSLPDGFGKEMLKSLGDALKVAYEAEPVAGFSYVNPREIQSYLPDLPASQQTTMQQTAQIIRRSHDSLQDQKNSYLFNKTFYDSMIAKYPELAVDVASENEESGSDDAPLFNSKMQMQFLMEMLSRQIDNYEYEYNIGEYAEDDESASTSDYEASASSEGDASENIMPHVMLQQHYGLDASGDLAWWHYRRQMSDAGYPNYEETGEGMIVDVLTRLAPLSQGTPAFPRLENASQSPNRSNTVDMQEYTKSLYDYYQTGGGTEIGKMIFQSYERYRRYNNDYGYDYDDNNYEYEGEVAQAAAVESVEAEVEDEQTQYCISIEENLEDQCQAKADRMSYQTEEFMQACIDLEKVNTMDYVQNCQ